MNNEQTISALRRRAIAWGGDIVQVTNEMYDRVSGIDRDYCIADGPYRKDFYGAPFTSGLGILWSKKKIYCTNSSEWPGVVHEMGHVFTSKKDPNHADDWEFFGWEYATFWVEKNRDYIVEDGESFGYLTRTNRRKVLQERLTHAKKIGLLRHGIPQAVR